MRVKLQFSVDTHDGRVVHRVAVPDILWFRFRWSRYVKGKTWFFRWLGVEVSRIDIPRMSLRGCRKRYPDPEWFAYVREGDVFQTPSGDFRVVRSVSYHKGKFRSLEVVIRRRSWTNRPLTSYEATQFRGNGVAVGWKYVGARVRLTGAIDAEIRREATENLIREARRIFYHHVRGVP